MKNVLTAERAMKRGQGKLRKGKSIIVYLKHLKVLIGQNKMTKDSK